MSVNAGRTKLYNSFKNFRVHWEAIQSVWNDAARHEFEESFFEPLERQLHTTLRAIDRLDTALMRFKNDCS
jgi:hypothetical protein